MVHVATAEISPTKPTLTGELSNSLKKKTILPAEFMVPGLSYYDNICR
jgi:hypothetical protein